MINRESRNRVEIDIQKSNDILLCNANSSKGSQLQLDNCSICDTNKIKATLPDFNINNLDENKNYLYDEEPLANYLVQKEATSMKVFMRKIICNPSTWKCKMLKTAVNTGQEHVS